MSKRVHRSLVKPFDPSSRAAAAEGPKTRMPCASRWSANPATRGASGPTTTSPMSLSLAKAATAA